MIKTITPKVKEFFDALPDGRVDEFKVSRELIDSDAALQFCLELNLACKFSFVKGCFTFSNLDFHEADMGDYETIVAYHGTDGTVKRWVPHPSQAVLDLMDYRSSILSDSKLVIHSQKPHV